MPTQEEKLAKLEQTTTEHIKETARRTREINEHLTMAIGLIQRQSFEMNAINRRTEIIQDTQGIHFDATNTHLELLQKHAEKTDKRLDAIEIMLAEILNRLPEKS